MGMIIFNIGLIFLNIGCLLLNRDNDRVTKTAKCMNVITIIILCAILILRIVRMGAE